MTSAPSRRELVQSERHVPEMLQEFLLELEQTTHSQQVWMLLVALGQRVGLPYIDFVSASSFADWRPMRFIRTSYDSSWFDRFSDDLEMHRWSYFRHHSMRHLTPVLTGLEFIDEYHPIPPRRLEFLQEAARNGLRAGFTVPLRIHAPPQAAHISFSGEHSKREMLAIVKAHGWLLHAAAITGHQRYVMHFAGEFTERNKISEKQRELLVMIGSGMQDKNIADKLGISVSAVRKRMNILMEKTGLSNRAELASLAMCSGIVPDPLERNEAGKELVLVEMGTDRVSSTRKWEL